MTYPNAARLLEAISSSDLIWWRLLHKTVILAAGGHYQGKGETVALERNNGQQRHWTAALRRRSIVVSKSLAMIERRVALFAHLHVNGLWCKQVVYIVKTPLRRDIAPDNTVLSGAISTSAADTMGWGPP
jgi:hypothetical protein